MGFSGSSDGKESAGNTGDPVLIHGLEISPEKWNLLSHVWLFVTPWTIESMEFSRPEYWNGQPFPSPGYLPGIEPRSPALQADSLPADPQGKAKNTGVGSLSLLQWIFLTQESNRGFLHCRQIFLPTELLGEGNGNPLQYSCLVNSMDREAWQATVHGSQKVGHAWANNTHEQNEH